MARYVRLDECYPPTPPSLGAVLASIESRPRNKNWAVLAVGELAGYFQAVQLVDWWDIWFADTLPARATDEEPMRVDQDTTAVSHWRAAVEYALQVRQPRAWWTAFCLTVRHHPRYAPQGVSVGWKQPPQWYEEFVDGFVGFLRESIERATGASVSEGAAPDAPA